jgi:hypothetical protein
MPYRSVARTVRTDVTHSARSQSTSRQLDWYFRVLCYVNTIPNVAMSCVFGRTGGEVVFLHKRYNPWKGHGTANTVRAELLLHLEGKS